MAEVCKPVVCWWWPYPAAAGALLALLSVTGVGDGGNVELIPFTRCGRAEFMALEVIAFSRSVAILVYDKPQHDWEHRYFIVPGAVRTGQFTEGPCRVRGVGVDFPLLTCVSLMIAAPSFRRWAKARRRESRGRRGLCSECGYDVRASRERCSECGHSLEGSHVQSSPVLPLDRAERRQEQRRPYR
jgi:hypothetical protein